MINELKLAMHKFGMIHECEVERNGIKFNVRFASDRHEIDFLNGGDYVKYRDVKKGDLVIDIGANTGGFSLYCASKGAKVYAFEPYGPAFTGLCENIFINGFYHSIHPYKLAVNGTDKLFCNKSNTSTNSLYQKPRGARIPLGESTPVECVTLNSALERVIGDCNFLKIDCEGCEWTALEKADLGKVGYIALEYHTSRGQDFEDLVKILEGNGFFCTIEPKGDTFGMIYGERT